MTKIPLEIIELEDESYHLLVRVLVNGEIEGKMVVDTGASRTVIDANLQLAKEETEKTPETMGIGGQVEVSLTHLKKIAFEEFEISDISLAMIDLAAINTMYEKASQQRILGLLGSDLLLKYKAKIDYKERCLWLEK